MKQQFLPRMIMAFLAALALGPFTEGQPSLNATDPSATLKQYCFTCHNDKLKTGSLSLESMDLAHMANAPDVWEKVIRKALVGMMPPQGLPQPEPAARKALVTWLEASLDRAAAAKPNPGRPFDQNHLAFGRRIPSAALSVRAYKPHLIINWPFEQAGSRPQSCNTSR